MERKIYQFTDWTGKERYADPAAVYRRMLEASKGGITQALKDYQSKDPSVMSPAFEILTEAALFGFELKRFDPETGDGWLEANLIALVIGFNNYLLNLKKKPDISPTDLKPSAA